MNGCGAKKKMVDNPLISVIIPMYNAEKYITSEYGRKTIKAMNDIVDKVNKNA